VNLTISSGVRASPGLPPMVPRIPEIDLMRVNVQISFKVTLQKDDAAKLGIYIQASTKSHQYYL
jgi:hypothetical protein